MYIMCVCLFSALSCRVGALQISIIIIIIIIGDNMDKIKSISIIFWVCLFIIYLSLLSLLLPSSVSLSMETREYWNYENKK